MVYRRYVHPRLTSESRLIRQIFHSPSVYMIRLAGTLLPRFALFTSTRTWSIANKQIQQAEPIQRRSHNMLAGLGRGGRT